MELGQFIRNKRKEKGLSAKDLSQITSISEGHILYIERGKRKPTFDIVSKLIKGLNLRWNEFLTETGYLGPKSEPTGTGRTRKIPIIALVNAGEFERHDITKFCDEDCIEVNCKEENIFAVRVACDSMEPKFMEGDIVIVNPDRKANSNDFVIVSNGEHEATLKQLKIFGKQSVLHPLNSKYDDIPVNKSEYHIIGVVVEKVTKYY